MALDDLVACVDSSEIADCAEVADCRAFSNRPAPIRVTSRRGQSPPGGRMLDGEADCVSCGTVGGAENDRLGSVSSVARGLVCCERGWRFGFVGCSVGESEPLGVADPVQQ